MGNNSSREATPRRDQSSAAGNGRTNQSPTFSFSFTPPPNDRSGSSSSTRADRGTRNYLDILSHNGSGSVDPHGQRRETRQEKEARRQEKEKLLRTMERNRSMKEEGVDGGYLVTLGVYVGPEDYSKIVVRQLQVRSFWLMQ